MSRLYLCEKPSQGRDIARVLGASSQSKGYLSGTGVIVTWCFGHLLEMAPPEAYDPALKRWSLQSLPIIPERWRFEVKPKSAAQLKVIKGCLAHASEVVIATDADREGESIAREVLERLRWRGSVLRLWLSALDEASIRKALAQLRPGAHTEALYQAGRSRAQADWLVGMNLTRLYTVLGRGAGEGGVRSVGRVQTPTLRLVVDRDREIEAFVPKPYWDLLAELEAKGGRFRARWQPPEQFTDAEGRCIQEAAARGLAQRLAGSSGRILELETKRVKEAPPLPLDLSTLQRIANKRWGTGAQVVLNAAQALYETYKATTYPRTDCRYLPESQHGEAPAVLAALRRSDPELAAAVDGADATVRSKCWNERKVTAHHAIIPTSATVDLSRLPETERQLYDLIRRHYLVQFYPDLVTDRTRVVVDLAQERFLANGSVVRAIGWRSVLGSERAEDEPVLPALAQGEPVAARNLWVEAKQTRPPPRYTEGTLIAAMKDVGRQVSDAKLRRLLKETAGIGTEATRASILETLFKRGYLRRQKRQLVSTEEGRALVDILPPAVQDPTTTALWEQALEAIAQGGGQADAFLARQAEWVRQVVAQAGAAAKAQPKTSQPAQPLHPCPECGQPMQRRKGKRGWFWGCSAYPDCRATRPDKGGKPGEQRPPRAAGHASPSTAAAGSPCPTCGQGKLVLRTLQKGRDAGREFIGCSCFPKCRHFAWNDAASSGVKRSDVL